MAPRAGPGRGLSGRLLRPPCPVCLLPLTGPAVLTCLDSHSRPRCTAPSQRALCPCTGPPPHLCLALPGPDAPLLPSLLVSACPSGPPAEGRGTLPRHPPWLVTRGLPGHVGMCIPSPWGSPEVPPRSPATKHAGATSRHLAGRTRLSGPGSSVPSSRRLHIPLLLRSAPHS